MNQQQVMELLSELLKKSKPEEAEYKNALKEINLLTQAMHERLGGTKPVPLDQVITTSPLISVFIKDNNLNQKNEESKTLVDLIADITRTAPENMILGFENTIIELVGLGATGSPDTKQVYGSQFASGIDTLKYRLNKEQETLGYIDRKKAQLPSNLSQNDLQKDHELNMFALSEKGQQKQNIAERKAEIKIEKKEKKAVKQEMDSQKDVPHSKKQGQKEKVEAKQFAEKVSELKEDIKKLDSNIADYALLKEKIKKLDSDIAIYAFSGTYNANTYQKLKESYNDLIARRKLLPSDQASPLAREMDKLLQNVNSNFTVLSDPALNLAPPPDKQSAPDAQKAPPRPVKDAPASPSSVSAVQQPAPDAQKAPPRAKAPAPDLHDHHEQDQYKKHKNPAQIFGKKLNEVTDSIKELSKQIKTMSEQISEKFRGPKH